MTIIDKFSNKMMFSTSMVEWLYLYHNDVQKWLDDFAHPTDHPLLWKMFMADPLLGKAIVESNQETNENKISYLVREISEGSKIVLLIGQRGSGKTALMFYLAEQIHQRYPHRKICILESSYINLPAWIEPVYTIFDAPEGSIILFDEASITYAARDAMTKTSKDLTNLLAISRHQGLTVLFVSQHSGLVDINILRMADVFIFKRLSWEELYGKDKKRAGRLLQYVRLMQPRDEKGSLFTDGEKWYNIETPLPTFWDETVSKSFKKVSKSEAIQMARKMYDDGVSPKNICKQLLIRGIDWTEQDVIFFVGRGKSTRSR